MRTLRDCSTVAGLGPEHRDKDCDAEQADRMAESTLRRRIIAARWGIDATMPVLTPESE